MGVQHTFKALYHLLIGLIELIRQLHVKIGVERQMRALNCSESLH